MLTFNVHTTIDEERIVAILWGAIDGDYGSSYSWIEKMKPFPIGKGDVLRLPSYFLIDADTEEYRLDSEAIQKGLNLMREKAPYQYSLILREEDDAETSDTLLQYSLFGELRFC